MSRSGSHSSSYYQGTSSSRDHSERRVPLPPIRAVLGDVLDQRPYDAYDFRGTAQALPTIGPYDQPTHSRSIATHNPRGSSQTIYSGQHSPQQPQASRPHTHAHGTTSSYHVHRPSSTGELILERTSPVDQFPKKGSKSDPGQSSKRYVCEECSERFDRPSALDTHMRTHDGEQPFQCSVSGCYKRFNVRSNMLRHVRTHAATSAFEYVQDDDDLPARSGASRSRGRGSSSAQPATSSSQSNPSAQYYHNSYRQ